MQHTLHLETGKNEKVFTVIAFVFRELSVNSGIVMYRAAWEVGADRATSGVDALPAGNWVGESDGGVLAGSGGWR
jgi:hypothetical protein